MNHEKTPQEQQQERAPVRFLLGHTALDYMAGFARVDGTTVADQLRTAVADYTHRRLQEPSPLLLIDREHRHPEVEVWEVE